MRKKLSKIPKFVFLVFGVLVVTAIEVLADGAAAVPAVGAGAGGAAGPGAQGPLGMLLPFVLMFGVIYFLMIRPQQKRFKEQQKMLSELAQGDEVVTASGILGTIRGITEKVVTLEVADNVKLKVLKSQINQVIKGQIKDLA